jgi:hypothetical protein
MSVLVLAVLSRGLALIRTRSPLTAIAVGIDQAEEKPAKPRNGSERYEPENKAVEEQAGDKPRKHTEEKYDELQLTSGGEEPCKPAWCYMIL